MAQGDGINPNYNLSGMGLGITGSPYVDSANPFMAMGRPYAADISNPALAPHMQPYSDSLVRGLAPLPEMEGRQTGPVAQPNMTRTPAAPQGGGFPTMGGMVTPQQMQSMIAPYQAMAQKAFPTDPIFGNGAFQAAHPRVAGGISNFLLAASMIKPGMTVGENISNVAGGVLGAKQFGREQQLRQAMFPYQMLTTQLGPQELLTRMYQQGQMGRYYGMHGDYMAGAATDLANSKALAAQELAAHRGQKEWTGADGRLWTYNPANPEAGAYPVAGAGPGTFVPPRGGGGPLANMTQTQLALIAGAKPGTVDPDMQDQAKRAIGVLTQMAGGKAGAEASAKEPTVQENSLVSEAKQTALEQWKAQKPPNNPMDWAMSTGYKGKDLQGDFQKAQKTWNSSLEDKMADVTKYQTSGAAGKGITHQDWTAAKQGQVPSDIPTNQIIYKNSKPVTFLRNNVRVDLTQ
jgi:hypothetical protein